MDSMTCLMKYLCLPYISVLVDLLFHLLIVSGRGHEARRRIRRAYRHGIVHRELRWPCNLRGPGGGHDPFRVWQTGSVTDRYAGTRWLA